MKTHCINVGECALDEVQEHKMEKHGQLYGQLPCLSFRTHVMQRGDLG